MSSNGSLADWIGFAGILMLVIGMMAAVALAIGGGGTLSSAETTVLMTVEETMDALRKTEQVRYQAPAAAPDS